MDANVEKLSKEERIFATVVFKFENCYKLSAIKELKTHLHLDLKNAKQLVDEQRLFLKWPKPDTSNTVLLYYGENLSKAICIYNMLPTYSSVQMFSKKIEMFASVIRTVKTTTIESIKYNTIF